MFGELLRRDAEPLGVQRQLADAMIKQDQYAAGESLSDPPRDSLNRHHTCRQARTTSRSKLMGTERGSTGVICPLVRRGQARPTYVMLARRSARQVADVPDPQSSDRS